MLPRLFESPPMSPVRIDFVSPESSGEVPALGDEDIIADGGTEVMRRAALTSAQAAPIPQAPITKPMLDLLPDDREQEQEPRIERTQRFERASLFPRPTPMPPMVMPIAALNVPPPRSAPNDKPQLAIAVAIGGVLLLCATVFVTIAVRTILARESSTNETSTVVAAPREVQPSPAQEESGIPVVSPSALPSAPYANAGSKARSRSSR